jgi:hypothetical protein
MKVTRIHLQMGMFACALGGWAFVTAQNSERQWLAGDSHIHSHWSADYDTSKNPPEPIVGVDGRYSTPVNAYQAKRHGLAWMVTTDHGGPLHSKLNFTRAYAELKASRELVPDLLQFYGMELNMPAISRAGSTLRKPGPPIQPATRKSKPGVPSNTSASFRCCRSSSLTTRRDRRKASACTDATSPASFVPITTSRPTCIAGWKGRQDIRLARSHRTGR